MVQRSDDKGDKRSPGKSSESEASHDAESNAAKALRERIRQAGAATARASDHAPPANGLIVPNSSAPPSAEHSGVRTRPPEPRQTSITPPLFGPPRLTPGAMAVPWPAIPRRRELGQTRDGLGSPTPPPLPGSQKEGERRQPVDPLMATAPAHTAPPSGLGWSRSPDSESAARVAEKAASKPPPLESGPAPRGVHTTPRGIAPPPLDNWTLSTARTQPMPRVRSTPPHSAAAQPRSVEDEERRRVEMATTKKTQGLLRAPDSSGSNVGRYSVHDVSTEYVDTGAPDTPAGEEHTALGEEPITEEVPALDQAALEAETASSGEPEADTRPRRSTPKQRVGHRRSSRPEMGHARERGTKRTDPGIRARTLRGGAVPTPKPVPPPLPASQPPALQPPAARTSPLPAANLTQPPTAATAITQRTVLPGGRPVSSKPPALPASAGSIVIDPSLSQPNLPAPTHKPSGSGYVPLPRDREAYEAFLRSAAGEHGGAPRARPSWAQQETALIPRDALEPPSYEDSAEQTSFLSARVRALLGVVLIVLSAGVGWWILEGQTAPPSKATTSLSAASTAHETEPTPASRLITLIATEPTGAELLLDGAVIGNTPLEVARPVTGEALYLVRFRGFEHQMVRITSSTHAAIHITLTPAPAEAPPPPAKR
jgi:hypothetical protein